MAQTHRHTDGHGDSMTDLAQRAESVKTKSRTFQLKEFLPNGYFAQTIKKTVFPKITLF